MREALAAMFSSKKFLTALVGTLVAIGLRFGIDLDPALVTSIVALFAAAIVGQGLADHGKEGAKVTTDAMAEAARVRAKNGSVS